MTTHDMNRTAALIIRVHQSFESNTNSEQNIA